MQESKLQPAGQSAFAVAVAASPRDGVASPRPSTHPPTHPHLFLARATSSPVFVESQARRGNLMAPPPPGPASR